MGCAACRELVFLLLHLLEEGWVSPSLFASAPNEKAGIMISLDVFPPSHFLFQMAAYTVCVLV